MVNLEDASTTEARRFKGETRNVVKEKDLNAVKGKKVEKNIDGFGEMFRWLSFKKINTSALQSRALAGVANGKYIFNLPGSPSACKDGWDEILKYQLDVRHKPCNFVEIMPRLQEHKFSRSKN